MNTNSNELNSTNLELFSSSSSAEVSQLLSLANLTSLILTTLKSSMPSYNAATVTTESSLLMLYKSSPLDAPSSSYIDQNNNNNNRTSNDMITSNNHHLATIMDSEQAALVDHQQQRQQQLDASSNWTLIDVNVMLTIVYLAIFLIGVVGNVCNCLVIADSRNKYMKTATNYYLFSLSVSDLLLLTFGLPHDIVNLWHPSPYMFNQFVCISRGWISEASTNASVLVIVAFTVERYLAICHPLKAHTLSRLSRSIKIIISIWLIASTCALVVVMQYGVIIITEKKPNGEDVANAQCTTVQRNETIFELSVFIFFIVPMAVITILYVKLGCHLRQKTHLIKQSQLKRQQRLMSCDSQQQSAVSMSQVSQAFPSTLNSVGSQASGTVCSNAANNSSNFRFDGPLNSYNSNLSIKQQHQSQGRISVAHETKPGFRFLMSLCPCAVSSAAALAHTPTATAAARAAAATVATLTPEVHSLESLNGNIHTNQQYKIQQQTDRRIMAPEKRNQQANFYSTTMLMTTTTTTAVMSPDTNRSAASVHNDQLASGGVRGVTLVDGDNRAPAGLAAGDQNIEDIEAGNGGKHKIITSNNFVVGEETNFSGKKTSDSNETNQQQLQVMPLPTISLDSAQLAGGSNGDIFDGDRDSRGGSKGKSDGADVCLEVHDTEPLRGGKNNTDTTTTQNPQETPQTTVESNSLLSSKVPTRDQEQPCPPRFLDSGDASNTSHHQHQRDQPTVSRGAPAHLSSSSSELANIASVGGGGGRGDGCRSGGSGGSSARAIETSGSCTQPSKLSVSSSQIITKQPQRQKLQPQDQRPNSTSAVSMASEMEAAIPVADERQRLARVRCESTSGCYADASSKGLLPDASSHQKQQQYHYDHDHNHAHNDDNHRQKHHHHRICSQQNIMTFLPKTLLAATNAAAAIPTPATSQTDQLALSTLRHHQMVAASTGAAASTTRPPGDCNLKRFYASSASTLMLGNNNNSNSSSTNRLAPISHQIHHQSKSTSANNITSSACNNTGNNHHLNCLRSDDKTSSTQNNNRQQQYQQPIALNSTVNTANMQSVIKMLGKFQSLCLASGFCPNFVV